MSVFSIASVNSARTGIRPLLLRQKLASFSSTCCLSNSVHVTNTSPSAVPSTSMVVNDKEHASTTLLVDSLLMQTRDLMEGANHHVVAYSGGVDSSLVCALLKQILGRNNNDTVQAVLGVSPAVSLEQVQQARRVAHCLQMDLVEIETQEQTSSEYVANQGKACLACKTHLYSALQSVIQHTCHTTGEEEEAHLYNGTNADDVLDTTRLGLIAARNFEVKSPLIRVSKQDVRRAAKWLGLPNHDVAAAPCLRSRLALGVEATEAHLHRIARAERRVRTLLQLCHTHNLRVRMLAGSRAMVEVDEELVEKAQDVLKELVPYFESLGFVSVRVRAFKTGSVARRRATTTADAAAMDYSEEPPMVASG